MYIYVFGHRKSDWVTVLNVGLTTVKVRDRVCSERLKSFITRIGMTHCDVLDLRFGWNFLSIREHSTGRHRRRYAVHWSHFYNCRIWSFDSSKMIILPTRNILKLKTVELRVRQACSHLWLCGASWREQFVWVDILKLQVKMSDILRTEVDGLNILISSDLAWRCAQIWWVT